MRLSILRNSPMRIERRRRTAKRACRMTTLIVVLSALLTGCGTRGEADVEDRTSPPGTATLASLPLTAPPLPFADNPDPALCGVPRAWLDDEPARVTGVYAGELVQPVVFLYDSHLRNEVIGQIPHGGRVEIELSQSNPELDYYRVRSLDMQPVQEGWLPAPFLSFEPVT